VNWSRVLSQPSLNRLANLGKGATDMLKGATTNAFPNVDKITKGVGDLFKKK